PVVNGIVVHQTGGSTAQSTFNSYRNSTTGAHFLVEKDGKIYQTASLHKASQPCRAASIALPGTSRLCSGRPEATAVHDAARAQHAGAWEGFPGPVPFESRQHRRGAGWRIQ